jgi:spermidine synthase
MAELPVPRVRPLLGVFASSVFLSAFLLFLVQPLFGKLALPLLGGSPAVWNTCMLFFQAALLGGYLYAHLSSRLDVRRQAAVHLALLAGAALALPLSLRGAVPTGGEAPVPWLLLLMLTTVGPPFLVLSGTGPILQRWFSLSGHPDARDPYWLYAASNLGSMLALLAYPLLVEPGMRLAGQSAAWAVGYGLLGALVAACALLVGNREAPPAEAESFGAADAGAPSLRERAVWVGLAFIPSSLLLGATTYITTDLAPVPLLWVLPLALYLLTFTLAFARRVWVPHRWMVAVQPAVLAGVALLLLLPLSHEPALAIPVHLVGLWVTAMVCHGELARRRPPASRLTEFYLWIAVGGVLGGVFNVLVAPVVFSRTWEYPLVLALACLARPWPEGPLPLRAHLSMALRAGAFAYALLLLAGESLSGLAPWALVPMGVLLVGLLARVLGRTPLWLAASLGAVLVVQGARTVREPGVLLSERSFFGHYRVARTVGNGVFHSLQHGSTVHGAQNLDPARRREPLTYYDRRGPLGAIFAAGPAAGARRVAVVGLGTGASAAYAARGDEWTFYEIDPGIERIARDRRYFTYLADSPAPTRVVLGDARLSLARAPEGAYDLLLLDAFSSDAVPVHLLTREALDLYLSRLAPGGWIAFHVSNRYLELERVVGALARERGLAARIGEGPRGATGAYAYTSTWVVVARSERHLGALARHPGWREPGADPGFRGWTDDYSSVLEVFSR